MEIRLQPIQWYPGHMAKAKRLLQDQLKRVDLLIELCDARIPVSSRNPDLKKLSQHKPGLLLLNKADLAQPGITEQWLKFFRTAGEEALTVDSRSGRGKPVLDALGRLSEEILRKHEARGIHKTIRAMVVGVPNVGKSTLINQLHGSRITQTGDRPGVTRANQWVRVTPYLELLDTPGLLWPKLEDQQSARRLSYIGTISDAVVDLNELCLCLLDDLMEATPEAVVERFHVQDATLRGLALMEAVCRGRGWILKGNECDYDRCGRVVLDEFRGGKLGRISLEKPETFKRSEPSETPPQHQQE